MRRRMRARLRALRQVRLRRARKQQQPTPSRESVLSAISAACLDASLGLDLCAKRWNPSAAALALRCRMLAAQMRTPPRARMADRMRWEWLASTASLLEPTPERRLIAECLRVFDPALDLACAFRGDLPLIDELVELIRSLESLQASLRVARSEPVPI